MSHPAHLYLRVNVDLYVTNAMISAGSYLGIVGADDSHGLWVHCRDTGTLVVVIAIEETLLCRHIAQWLQERMVTPHHVPASDLLLSSLRDGVLSPAQVLRLSRHQRRPAGG